MNVLDAIRDSLTNTFNTTADFLPTLVSALVIFIIGWIVARVVRAIVNRVLKAVQFDSLADRVGVNGFLTKGGIKRRASGLLSTLVYWIIMFTVWVMVFNTLGLEVVSELLTDVIHFIPNIIVACILLVVGAYLAEFVSGLVVASLKGGGFESSELVGRVAYGAVMFFAVVLALNQLNIGDGILDKVVSIVLGGLGLGLAIAFGLGGKDWAAGVINKISKG